MKRPAALLVMLVLASGCGGSPGPAADSSGGRPVTDDQALVLAQLLERNRRLGGARFDATFQIDGQDARATGRVDFRNGRGTAIVRPVDPAGGAPRRFFWTRRAVLAQAAPGAPRYDRQAPDPDRDPIHHVFAFVNLLAAETIDNTANLRDQGVRFLSTDRVDGVAVDVYALGDATRFEVGHADGLLHGASIRGTLGPVALDLRSHVPITVTVPEAG